MKLNVKHLIVSKKREIMIRSKLIACFLILLISKSFSQDEFVIGMWNLGGAVTHIPSSNGRLETSKLFTGQSNPLLNGQPTSNFQVLYEDGFNINWYPMPDLGTTYNQYADYINLCANNDMKLIDHMYGWYKPYWNGTGTPVSNGDINLIKVINGSPITAATGGIERYNHGWGYIDNSYPVSGNGNMPIWYNYDDVFNFVLDPSIMDDQGTAPLASHVYMHDLGTEMSFFHQYYTLANETSPLANPGDGGDCALCDPNCGLLGNLGPPPKPQYKWAAEVPQQNVANALTYFKNYPTSQNPATRQNFAIGVATHQGFFGSPHYFGHYNATVHANTPSCPYGGSLFETHYLWYPNVTVNNQAITPMAGNAPDAIREGSYYTADNCFEKWINPSQSTEYLGKFKNIDMIRWNGDKQWGYNKILSENNFECFRDGNNDRPYCMHSNKLRPNANWMRFLNYTALIHGVDGLIFYTLGDMYLPSENQKLSYMADAGQFSYLPGRFDRANFPDAYNDYVKNLSRELRYLLNKNLIGAYANPPSGYQVLYWKRDEAVDPNGILPSFSTYLPSIMPAADATDFFAYSSPYQNPPASIPPGAIVGNGFDNTAHITREHGLRYTINQNTNTGEVIMIVSNPNPYSLHNVPFNFNNISQVQNTRCVDVLFENGEELDVNSLSYKTDVTPSVSEGDFKLLKKYSIPFCNNTFMCDFGSFDVKIFYFNPNCTGPEDYNTTYNSGWEKTWSNNGDGTLGAWGNGSPNFNTSDVIVPIDFDADGKDELLCVQSINAGPATPAWAKVVGYDGTGWNISFWDNGNNGLFPGWYISATNKYIVGDFDKDGYDNDLLLINQNCAAILHADPVNGTFNWIYYNNCDPTVFPGWSHNMQQNDKYIVGDFNFDGKRNEVVVVKGAFQGDWIVKSFQSGNFVTMAGGIGSGTGPFLNVSNGPFWQVGANDEYLAGDFNDDGYANEVMCVDRGNGAPAAMIQIGIAFPFVSTMKYYTNNGNFGGWGSF